jgi:hypothetical protein
MAALEAVGAGELPLTDSDMNVMYDYQRASKPSVVLGLLDEVERLRADAKTWSCPDCAFTFCAYHTNEDGSLTCPACEQQATNKQLASRDAEVDAAWNATGIEGAVRGGKLDVRLSEVVAKFKSDRDSLRSDLARLSRELEAMTVERNEAVALLAKIYANLGVADDIDCGRDPVEACRSVVEFGNSTCDMMLERERQRDSALSSVAELKRELGRVMPVYEAAMQWFAWRGTHAEGIHAARLDNAAGANQSTLTTKPGDS